MDTANQFEQEFKQNVAREAEQEVLIQDKKQKNQKKWLVIILFAIVSLATIAMVIVALTNNVAKEKMTPLLNLYSRLEDELTFEGFSSQLEQVVPGAKISYDEGLYIVLSDDGMEHISFMIKNEENDNIAREDSNLEKQTYDVESLQNIVNTAMIENDEVENGEEDSIEEDTNDGSDGDIPTIEVNDVVSHFVYSCFGETNDDLGNVITDELSIRQNYDGEGYYYSDSNYMVLFSNKNDAIEYLLESDISN